MSEEENSSNREDSPGNSDLGNSDSGMSAPTNSIGSGGVDGVDHEFDQPTGVSTWPGEMLVFPVRGGAAATGVNPVEAQSWTEDPAKTGFKASLGSGRMHARKGPRYLLFASIAAFLLLVVAGFLVMNYLGASSGKPGGKAVAIDVPPGSSYPQLEQRLFNKRVIGSLTDFSIFLKLSGNVILQPGYYVFRENESYSGILAGIAAGPKTYKLTIPDGFSLVDIARAIGSLPGHSTNSFLALAESTPPTSTGFSAPGITSSLGFLFPDTYSIDPTWSNHQIMNVMLDRFAQIAKQLGLDPQGTYHGLSGYQVVVAASIIEREAKAVSDYPKVARVILNRIRANMPLQMDSTVRFATGNYSGPLTVGQLQDSSPYNTYTHLGLPPSPISSPDKAAMAAVLHPAVGNWLYFVTLKGRSLSSFFDTYQQQQAAISASGGL